MTMKDNIKGWAHLGIPAVDLEASVKWYVDNLGFEVVYEKNLPEEPCHAVFLRKGDVELEIYQNDAEMIEELKTRKHGHIDHLALKVDDVYAAFEEMKKVDCVFLDQEVQTLPFYEKGVAWFTVLGPNGEKVEFNQVL